MKYSVYATVTGSKYIGEFEANSKEEAEDMAAESQEAYVNLCHQCSSECEDAEVTEFDAEEVSPMTVQELIKELQRMPMDAEVLYEGDIILE